MQPLLQLGLTLLLVALNGFFVAAEFALIRIRQTRIAELVDAGNARARTVKSLLSRLDTTLSATQLGVTLASLALGAVIEPTMRNVLLPLFRVIGINPASHATDGVALGIAFVLITSFHIVFGELLPKWWVIAHTEKTVLSIAPPMRLFLTVGYPLIKLLQLLASSVAKRLKLEPNNAHEQAHSEEEIIAIITHAHERGEVGPVEVEIAENVFDFAHTQAKEIMVPRVDMVYLSTEWSIAHNVEVAIDNGFTRYPLCEGDRDHVLGMVHIKDLLAISANPQPDIRAIKRPMIEIPENKQIDDLLKDLQKSHAHQALVMDEYGGTAGLVTLEDILEELVGEIQDEHDKPPPLQELDTEGRRYSVAGTVALDEVSETLGVLIENPDEYETIGGYALHQLRLPPRMGATARMDGFDVAVAEVTGRRIRRLLFTKHGTSDDVQARVAPEATA